MACLKLVGTEHEDTEELIILQSTGSKTSRHDFNRVVGMGSKEQDFEFDDMMIFFSLFSVVGSKL